MKKTVLIIVLAMMVTALFPTAVLAYDAIGVTGTWECEYEIDEYGVGASGGTADVILRVTNTHPTDDILYVSVSWGAGSASEFYEEKRVTIAPDDTEDVTFYIPVEEEDAGIPNTLWVGMTTRGSGSVEGIGAVTGIVFGPEPVYSSTCFISTSTPTINRGETVEIAFGGAPDGNKDVDIRVYDQDGYLVFSMDGMDILYLGKKEYAPQSTKTYQFTCEVYKPGSDTLIKEVVSDPLTVTVIQPTTPEPDPEPDPEPETEEPTAEPAETTPEPEVTSEPVVTSEPEITEEAEVSEEIIDSTESEEDVSLNNNQERVVVVESQEIQSTQSNQNTSDTLMMILLVLLVLIFAGLAAVLIYMVKSNKKQ